MKVDVTDASPATVISSDAGGASVALTNLGPDTVYLGVDADDADPAEGLPLADGESLTADVRPADALVAICDTGDTAELRVLILGGE